ncbi:fungal-specific transcription factor domain-containing protein [Xylaria digitata]|nr:fungal-specific transcription factor domain-containing protein [Xylaria digitata]
MAGRTTKEVVDGPEIDILNQENVSQNTNTLRRNSKQHIRHRASVACYSCRDRRIRCVVPKGASECTQCKRSGTECVIKMDDERRRPISKAYVSSLSARIGLLESMLKEKGGVVPPAIYPPTTRHEAQTVSSGDEVHTSAVEAQRGSKSDSSPAIRHVLSPPYSHEDMYDSPMEDLVSIEVPQSGKEALQKEHTPSRTLNPKREDVIGRLFFPNGGLSRDRLSGKLRFFGPTANCHVYAESPHAYDYRETPQQSRRAERIIRSLTPKTHDYLMQNFWKHQNCVLQVVDRTAFEADRGSECPRFYSPFLHIIILAVGWRFANQDRCEMARINLGNHESAIHREAKHMLEIELERPMGISTVQSLLLLADLECGVGRDETGWMYAGMANRLAFDIGLHIDCSSIGLSEQEVSVRRRVMKACVLYDKYWALFLGRPTSIKTQDISFDMFKSATSTTRLSEHSRPVRTDTQSLEEGIHEQLFKLMDLASQIVENRGETRPSYSVNRAGSTPKDNTDKNVSADTLILDQQLQEWYRQLPNHLAWGENNIRTAPCSYFLLHQQYQAIVILLHRSREAHGSAYNNGRTSPSPPSPKDASEALGTNQKSASSQGIDAHNQAPSTADACMKPEHSVCTQAAVQFAQIISQSKEKCDFGKICCTSLQPAGIASIALLAAIAQSKNEADRQIYLSSLEVVSGFIHAMSRSYRPAARMGKLIQAAFAQLHLENRNSRYGNEITLERSANSFKDDAGGQHQGNEMFSFLPGNREHSDRGQFFLNNQSCSDSARTRPSPPYMQYPHGDHLNIMSSLIPTFPDLPDSFVNLDSLYAMGVNSILPSRRDSDNYLRVAPSAKGCGLHSLHAASDLDQPIPDLDSHMPDWIGETASSNSTTARQTPEFSGQIATLSTDLGSVFDAESTSRLKRENSVSLEWVNSAGGLVSSAPMGTMNLRQRSENPELKNNGSDSTAPSRIYELDYLDL